MNYDIPIWKVHLVREGCVEQEGHIMANQLSVACLVKPMLINEDREHSIVVCLNCKRRVIGIHTVGIGTIDTCLVHPREVMKVAILSSSSSIILAHNHPSGDPSPSEADVKLTRNIQEAGTVMGIEVEDHLIIGGGSGTWVSLRNCGFMA